MLVIILQDRAIHLPLCLTTQKRDHVLSRCLPDLFLRGILALNTEREGLTHESSRTHPRISWLILIFVSINFYCTYYVVQYSLWSRFIDPWLDFETHSTPAQCGVNITTRGILVSTACLFILYVSLTTRMTLTD